MNIFKINKCKKIFFEKFPFLGGRPNKKIIFGQNVFARVSGKNKNFVLILANLTHDEARFSKF